MDYKDFELVAEHDNYLTITNEEGNEELFQIIFSIKSEKLGKTYVIFSRVSDIEQSLSEDGDEQIEVGAAEYVVDEEGNGDLIRIETEEEWAIIEQGLQEFDECFEELEDECGCGCGHDHCHCDEHGHEVCECECECEEDDNEHEHHCCCKHHNE